MADERDIARLEGRAQASETKLAMVEQALVRAEERINNLKDRVEKIETGLRNLLMTVIGLVLAAIFSGFKFLP